jgi:hypothetical protein
MAKNATIKDYGERGKKNILGWRQRHSAKVKP